MRFAARLRLRPLLSDAYQWPLIAAMLALALAMLRAGMSLASVCLVQDRG